ncbi:MAG TPA: 4Fe-4S dicluster domain-containing protein [Armatimonadota bacterium]|nr:4Fe-4S dicluster domain-containing protein [Armatimonadota bacterium]
MIRLRGSSLPGEIEALSGQRVFDCNQCAKCTAGCPMSFAMDIQPNQMIRLVQLGQADRLLRSKAIWLCSSCETCAARCPMSVSVAEVVDALRQLSRERGMADRSTGAPQFHQAFLDSVARHGRAHELEAIGVYKAKTRRFFDDIGLGIRMFRQGKLSLLPHRIQDRDVIRRIIRQSSGSSKT